MKTKIIIWVAIGVSIIVLGLVLNSFLGSSTQTGLFDFLFGKKGTDSGGGGRASCTIVIDGASTTTTKTAKACKNAYDSCVAAQAECSGSWGTGDDKKTWP